MPKILQYILPFKLQQIASDPISGHYEVWDKPSRQLQISATALLTVLLYIVFSLIDKSWASEHAQSLMLRSHLFIVVPILLIVSYLAYKRRFYDFLMIMLALAPIIAISCHAYIASQVADYSPYQMEGYMVIFWTFIISGLTFKYALISAICSSSILLVSAYYFMGRTDIYTIHVFWVFCSFSFGLLGALIYEKSRKAIFLSHQELLHIAVTDPLTGVFNRNQLNKVLQQEIERSLQNGQSFGLMILDVDHFKRVNDTLGHDEGDRVLKQTAQLLSEHIYDNDTLIRWGGEEFIVVALKVDEQELFLLCEKLRKVVEKQHFGTTGNMTISIGATLFNKNDSQNALISRADTALYEAKENGRNTSVFVK